MSSIIAKIGVYGDIHLNSKAYGAHREYPKECLEYFSNITDVTEKHQLTHLIGTGDFSFGRFHSLEFRDNLEKQLEKQYELVKGNRYELFGNHDEAGYGMTERDYYIKRGLLKESCNISVGNLNITMVDYGKHLETEPNIVNDGKHINIIIAHDFFKFKNSQLANFGKAIELDEFEKWYGVDYLICGHVHKILNFNGAIIKDGMPHNVYVHYPGCMTRPAYREGYLDEVGNMAIISVFDDGQVKYEIEIMPLWPLEKSFNLTEKVKEQKKKQEKADRVDISDIVKQLDSHDRNVGNPEDIIKDMQDIDEKYKNKAIDLLKEALG